MWHPGPVLGARGGPLYHTPLAPFATPPWPPLPQGVAPDAPLSGTLPGILRKLHFPEAKPSCPCGAGKVLARVGSPASPRSPQCESDQAQQTYPSSPRRLAPAEPGRPALPGRSGKVRCPTPSGRPASPGFMTSTGQPIPAIWMSTCSNGSGLVPGPGAQLLSSTKPFRSRPDHARTAGAPKVGIAGDRTSNLPCQRYPSVQTGCMERCPGLPGQSRTPWSSPASEGGIGKE